MTDIALAAKAGLAVVLIVAGAAKLADLPSFVAAARLLLPSRVPHAWLRMAAYGVVGIELGVGSISLALPNQTWLNTVVCVIACGFVLASAYGFATHRGRPCACFGGISGTTFDSSGVFRSVLVAISAAVALHDVPSTSAELTWSQRTLLAGAALLLAAVAFTAARALSMGREL